MGTQNLNNFYFNRLDSKINYSEYYDLFLASDEKDFNTDVVWSTGITAYNNGDILPVWIDLADTDCSTQPTTTCAFQYPTGNTSDYNSNTGYTSFMVLSKNSWSKAKSCCDCPYDVSPGYYEVCDAAWTATDNGLFTEQDVASGACIELWCDIPTDSPYWNQFDKSSYDKRFKMHQVKAFGFPTTGAINEWYTDTSILNASDASGYYQELKGGFYQGFYKLYGYPYEVLPTRPNKGWSFETYLKLTTISDSICKVEDKCCTAVGDNSVICGYYGSCYNASGWNRIYSATTASSINFGSATTFCSPLGSAMNDQPIHTLNYSSYNGTGMDYPITSSTSGFFFYKGVRAEDKYFASSLYSASSFWSGLVLDLTGSGCTTLTGITGCCNTEEKAVPLAQQNKSPDCRYDVYSNALGVRLTDDMRIGYRTIRYTGECVTTGETCNTGKTFNCDYVIEESYSEPICKFITQSGNCKEIWVQIDIVFDRNLYLEDCEIYNNGGVNDLVKIRTDKFERYGSHAASTAGPFGCDPVNPTPETKPCKDEYPRFIEDAYFDFNCHGAQIQSWFEEKEYRLGTLSFYVNGRRVHKVENYEEIIPRQLNTNKQTQVGVAYNMSWGGGTFGLRENLMPDCSGGTMTHKNLPPDQMMLNQFFAGTFVGGISQMMYYIKPLTPDEIYHNFLINKDRYSLIDCEECKNCNKGCTDCGYNGSSEPVVTNSVTIHVYKACQGPNPVPGYILAGYPVTILSDSFPSTEAASADYYQLIGSPPIGTVVQRAVTQNNGSVLYSCYEYVGVQTLAPSSYVPFFGATGGVNNLTVFAGGANNCDDCCTGCSHN